MEPPASFESPEARRRITVGLRRAGRTDAEADFGARVALGEAPFVPPTESSWAIACRRARQVASIGQPWGLYPRLDPESGLALAPRS